MKYPKELRVLWYRQVEREHRSIVATCAIFNIPRKTYYKWWNYDHGRASNEYKARVPDRKTKLTYDIKTFIVETKAKTNYGPLKMKIAVMRRFGVSVSTTIIYRFYRRKYLIRRPQKKLPWYTPMKEHLIVKQKGEGVQLDVKYVWEHGKRNYQFSVLDPYTELYHFTICDTRESKNAITAFLNAQTYFGFSILSIQTDNGSEFRGEFHKWLETQRIPHYFIPKKSPYWNAQVERVHKTIDDEFYCNPWRVWKTREEWLEYYNTERIHLTLGGITPREKVAETLSTVTP